MFIYFLTSREVNKFSCEITQIVLIDPSRVNYHANGRLLWLKRGEAELNHMCPGPFYLHGWIEAEWRIYMRQYPNHH